MSPVFLSWFTTVRGKTKESRTRPRATPFLSTRKFAYVCHNTLAHRQTHKTHLHFPSRCRIMLTIRGMLRVHTDKALRISCLCFFLLFFSFSSTPNLNTLSLIRLQEARSHSSSSSRSGQHDELPGPTKGMQLHYMHFTIFDLLLERVPALYVIFLFSSLFLSIHPLQPHPPPYFLLCSCNSCALGTLSKTEKKEKGAGIRVGTIWTGTLILCWRKAGDLFRLDDSIVLAVAKPGLQTPSSVCLMCSSFCGRGGGAKQKE